MRVSGSARMGLIQSLSRGTRLVSPVVYLTWAGMLAAAGMLAGCGRDNPAPAVQATTQTAVQRQNSPAEEASSLSSQALAPVATIEQTVVSDPLQMTVNSALKLAAAEAPVSPDGTDASLQPVAAVQPPALAETTPAAPVAIADLYRAFHQYEQQFKTNDPVCVQLMAENAMLYQTITSNQTAIANRLQSDSEWNRIRNELGEAQRAGDQTRATLAIQRRDAARSNALRRNAIMMRSATPVTTPAPPPHTSN